MSVTASIEVVHIHIDKISKTIEKQDIDIDIDKYNKYIDIDLGKYR